MFDHDFIDEVAPKHQRTSCTDERSVGNEYFNEFGFPRCVRCCLLYRHRQGEWPHGSQFRITGLRAIHGGEVDERITERMTE